MSHLKDELKESRVHVRMLDDELLTLSRDVEAIRTASWAAKEALKEEHLGVPKKIKEVIIEYKKSPRFELDLQRLGQVTYEFKYRVDFAYFCARYLNLELELNPFTDLPEDQDIQMPTEVPFDDNPESPPN